MSNAFIEIGNSSGFILVNNSSMGTDYGNNIYNYSVVLPSNSGESASASAFVFLTTPS